MIQDKCYNVHQDLRSIRETLNEGLSRFLDCKKLNKLVKKFEEDFKKKDLVRNDENDDTTATTNHKNDLLQFDSKMKSDSPESLMMTIKRVLMMMANKMFLWMKSMNKIKKISIKKKSVMDNENKDDEAVELSSSIKRCGHPMKHSYNLDVKG
nr:hypothetical protein [Tanacetum cinerariifolium]